MDVTGDGSTSSSGDEMERMTEAAALVRLRSRRMFRRVLALVEATALELSPTESREKIG